MVGGVNNLVRLSAALEAPTVKPRLRTMGIAFDEPKISWTAGRLGFSSSGRKRRFSERGAVGAPEISKGESREGLATLKSDRPHDLAELLRMWLRSSKGEARGAEGWNLDCRPRPD
jgi:hypothetical protein